MRVGDGKAGFLQKAARAMAIRSARRPLVDHDPHAPGATALRAPERPPRTGPLPAYERPDDVAEVREPSDDGPATVFLGRLPDGPIVTLDGTAAVIWCAATDEPAGRWLDAIALTLDGAVDDIRPQVLDFVESLETQGYLQAVTPRPRDTPRGSAEPLPPS